MGQPVDAVSPSFVAGRPATFFLFFTACAHIYDDVLIGTEMTALPQPTVPPPLSLPRISAPSGQQHKPLSAASIITKTTTIQ